MNAAKPQKLRPHHHQPRPRPLPKPASSATKNSANSNPCPRRSPLSKSEQAAIHAELADGSLYARDNALALQRTQRAADIDAELMAALERWELLGG